MTHWKHPSDTHGGHDKGSMAQDIVVKCLESMGATCKKTSRDIDQTGIDYIINYKNKEYKIAVNSTWAPQVNKNYCRFCYGGYINSMIPGISKSPVDLFFNYNVAHSDRIFYCKKDDLLNYVADKYGQNIASCNFTETIDDSLDRHLPQLRYKESTNLYDIWVLVPIERMRCITRSISTFDGIFD